MLASNKNPLNQHAHRYLLHLQNQGELSIPMDPNADYLLQLARWSLDRMNPYSAPEVGAEVSDLVDSLLAEPNPQDTASLVAQALEYVQPPNHKSPPNHLALQVLSGLREQYLPHLQPQAPWA